MRIWPCRSRAVILAGQKKLFVSLRAYTRCPIIAAHRLHCQLPTSKLGGGGGGGAGGASGLLAGLGFLTTAGICGLGSSHTLHFFAAAVLISVHRGHPHLYSFCGSIAGIHAADEAAPPPPPAALLEGVPGASKPEGGDPALGGDVASSAASAAAAAAAAAAASSPSRCLRFGGFLGGSPSHAVWQSSPQPPAQ